MKTVATIILKNNNVYLLADGQWFQLLGSIIPVPLEVVYPPQEPLTSQETK